MSELFIELYLDEDVSVLVADLVRARGFIAVTTRDASQLGNSDATQLSYAAGRQMTLVTHNRVDFENLATEYFEAGKSHYGIIVAARRTPHEIAARLLKILNGVSADEMKDHMRYI